MLVFEWQTTAVWTGQTWEDYKASLLANQCIVLMSVNDYNMTHFTLKVHLGPRVGFRGLMTNN
jgi:hypothetical protein